MIVVIIMIVTMMVIMMMMIMVVIDIIAITLHYRRILKNTNLYMFVNELTHTHH